MFNKLSIRRLAVLLTIAFGAGIISCGGEVDTGGDDLAKYVAAEMAKGQAQMANERYESALATFDNLIEKYNHAPAKFGWAYSRSLFLIDDVVDTVSGLLFTLLGAMNSTKEMSPEEIDDLLRAEAVKRGLKISPQQDPISMFINGVVRKYADDMIKINGYLEDAAAYPEFKFTLKSLPITVMAFKVGDLGGNYDRAEAYFGAAITKSLLGVIYSVTAISFSFSILDKTILDAIGRLISDGDPSIEQILGLVAYILENSSGFMGLNNDGSDKMVKAGNYFGGAAADIGSAIEIVENGGSKRKNAILAYLSNDDGEFIEVNLAMQENNIPGVKTDDVFLMPIDDNIKNAVANLSANLLEGGAPISWAGDINPAVSSIIFALLRTGFVRSLIESILSETEGAETILNLLNSSFLSSDLIQGLFLDIIPDKFQFDLGAYFTDPVGLREFLPLAYKNDNDVLASRFLFEWECSSVELQKSVVPGLICTDESLVDADHFPSSSSDVAPYDDDVLMAELGNLDFGALFLDAAGKYPNGGFGSSIAADGFPSRLPYIPFKDPTINGMLFVRLDTADNFEPATNRTLNLVLAELAVAILGIIDGTAGL